jgi:hypothetical protein
MLDDVERRRFLVHPAREDALILAVGALHVELDERAGQRLGLPRRALFAGAKPNDGVLDPHRLPGFQNQVADDSIALVEEAKHGDALRHRRRSLHRNIIFGLVDRDRLVADAVVLARLLLAVAAGEQKQRDTA